MNDYDIKSNLILEILDRLTNWTEIKKDFINYIIQSGNNEQIFMVKSTNVKKFLIEFISNDIESFNEEKFLYNLIKLYTIDLNTEYTKYSKTSFPNYSA